MGFYSSMLTEKTITTTRREKEVLAWLAKGKTCRESAAILGISENTVRDHVRHIYKKFSIGNRVEAVTLALRFGIITTNELRLSGDHQKMHEIGNNHIEDNLINT
jgi:DNA-binding CsgD family transcriptional regulator